MEYNYKKDFPLLAHSDIAYLDSAATAQRPSASLTPSAIFTACITQTRSAASTL